MITRTDVLAHLERNMRVGFLGGQNDYSSVRAPFVRETGSDGAFETYADMGATPWPVQNSGQSGAQGQDGRTGGQVVGGLNAGQGIQVLGGNERSMTIYNRDWDIPIGIEHNAINDGRLGSLDQWARTAGEGFEQHMDFLCFDALNKGEGTTYGNGYDGQPFFSATHADPGAEYATAQDNQNTLTLSPDNFETVTVAGSKFLSDRGQPIGASHDLLIVPSDLKRIGSQIAKNPHIYDTANNEMNPYEGTGLLVAPGTYLDSTAWFVADTRSAASKPIVLQVRQRPTLVFWDDHTQGNGIRYYKWVSRYEVFYGDWRKCVQGNT